ncbi:MAG: YIP1 family protein [Bryobacteraceae bacterium]|nr:YIP1 family protein [Bryobacteraceae bacterium]
MSSAIGGQPIEPRMSEAGRIFGIFWDPKPVYQDLAARPRWWAPLILLTALAVVYLAAFSSHVGWERFMEHEFQTNSRLQQLSPEQRDQMLQQQLKIVGVASYAGAVVGGFVMTVVIAALFLFVFKTLGGADLRFKQSFSITYYSFLPNALATILAIVVMFLVNPADFDLRNPVALNAGFFLDPLTSPRWLHAVATSLDLFSIWIMLLLALGFSTAIRKLKFGVALTRVVALWFVYVFLKTGWSAMFG